MKKSYRKHIFIFLIRFSISIFAVCFTLLCQLNLCFAKAKEIKEGNKLFAKKEYTQALEKYDSALKKDPDSALINYNKGCAQYKKGDFAQALKSFNKSILSEDVSLEAKAYYNMGNSKYSLAQNTENTNPNEAVNLYKESLGYYKKAIEKNSGDKAAKYNYEFTKKKIKALSDKLKQQPQQKESKDSQDQEKEKLEQKDSQTSRQKDEPQGERKQQGAEQREFSKKKEEETAASFENEENKPMSKEEAKMLLESFSEKEIRGEIKDKQHNSSREEYQDW